jgi:hypothetical protein
LGIYASKTQTFPTIFLFPKFQRTTSGFSPEKCVPFLKKNKKTGAQTSFYFAAGGGEILFTQPQPQKNGVVSSAGCRRPFARPMKARASLYTWQASSWRLPISQ